MHLAKSILYKGTEQDLAAPKPIGLTASAAALPLVPSVVSSVSHGALRMRAVQASDGAALWRLVAQVGTLELNTPYAYVLLASDFGSTCRVAEAEDGSLVGAVIGLRPPREPDCAFVWQVGVRPDFRGKGLALALLQAWHGCPAVSDARWLTATVAEGNRASQALFRRLAAQLRVACEVRPRFGAEMFPPGHPPEFEYRLGPFRPPARDP